MTQDEKLEAALARLTAALGSLESASRQILDADHRRIASTRDLDGELAQAMAKVARLEAASDEVSGMLKIATEALAAIVSSLGETAEDRVGSEPVQPEHFG